MLTVTMVGATFRPAEAKEIVRGLHIHDHVELRADPNNEYDATAVAVYSNDTHIGFIPKESNSALFAVLMDGATITAEVIAFENSLKPVLEIEFEQMNPYNEDQAISEESQEMIELEEVERFGRLSQDG